MQGPFVMY